MSHDGGADGLHNDNLRDGDLDELNQGQLHETVTPASHRVRQ